MIFIPDSPFHFIVLAELSALRTTAVACFSLLSILLKNTADLQVRAFTGRPQACTFQLLIVFLVVYTVCFFQNYTEILSDLDILWLICRTCRHESLKAVMSCSRHVIFSHSRENDSIITVLFPDCKEYCYINMIYQNHIYGEKFMIQNYILLFFEYNLQEESPPGSFRKALKRHIPRAIFLPF